MAEFVEPHVRLLVAHHLGVGVDELVAGVSLRDDLAADSLDLVELAMALEAEFAIVVPERVLDRMRTYGDLIEAIGLLIRARNDERPGTTPPVRMWTRLVTKAGKARGTLERADWLTPYTVQTIVEDAERTSHGARLDVVVAANITDIGLARAQDQFARLGDRGVRVTVRRDDRPPAPPDYRGALPSPRPQGVARAAGRRAFTHGLLDQLTGAVTTVTVSGYVGNDPWQADDLIASAGEKAKRFGDGTPSEQAQAISGSGPCQFLDGDPAGCGYRATTDGHHVHGHFADPHAAEHPQGSMEAESMHPESGRGFARNARYYQTERCIEPRPNGKPDSWREATYYWQDREGRAFEVASFRAAVTGNGHVSDRQRGLRAQFDLSAPSPNGFRPLTATLDGPAGGDACGLLIRVSAQVAGRNQLAEVRLHSGAGSTMDVRLLPEIAAPAS